MAKGLAEAGATVLVNSRHAQKAADQLAGLAALSLSVEALPFDVTDARGRRQALSGIARKYGRLDGVVNNAYAAPAGESPEAFLQAYDVAVASAWALSRDALELLRIGAQNRPGGASVVNIASMYGMVSPDLRIYSEVTPPNPPVYGPAKAALLQLTRYLACELGPARIRVNAVSPGPFPAPAVQRDDPEFVRRLGSRNPLGRIGQPHELIGPLIFLLSEASSYVTGTNLVVDGGWTAW